MSTFSRLKIALSRVIAHTACDRKRFNVQNFFQILLVQININNILDIFEWILYDEIYLFFQLMGINWIYRKFGYNFMPFISLDFSLTKQTVLCNPERNVCFPFKNWMNRIFQIVGKVECFFILVSSFWQFTYSKIEIVLILYIYLYIKAQINLQQRHCCQHLNIFSPKSDPKTPFKLEKQHFHFQFKRLNILRIIPLPHFPPNPQ